MLWIFLKRKQAIWRCQLELWETVIPVFPKVSHILQSKESKGREIDHWLKKRLVAALTKNQNNTHTHTNIKLSPSASTAVIQFMWTMYLSAVRHKTINQCVRVTEQSIELLGGLYRRRGCWVELLPLYWHWAAAGRCHALHLTCYLQPKQTKGKQRNQGNFILCESLFMSHFMTLEMH